MYEIVIGRSESDLKQFGLKGTIFLGKHYVRMGQTTSLSNKVYMDVARSHIVLVSGKKKKRYSDFVYDLTIENPHNFIANDIACHNSSTLGVIAEELSNLPEE